MNIDLDWFKQLDEDSLDSLTNNYYNQFSQLDKKLKINSDIKKIKVNSLPLKRGLEENLVLLKEKW